MNFIFLKIMFFLRNDKLLFIYLLKKRKVFSSSWLYGTFLFHPLKDKSRGLKRRALKSLKKLWKNKKGQDSK